MTMKHVLQPWNFIAKLRQRSIEKLIHRHAKCVRALQTSSANKGVVGPIGVQSTSDALRDAFGRQHDYLRISVTERCNLRCLYCMPKDGISLSPSSHLLSTLEIVYLSRLFISQGVRKIRLTGGEPTIRKDFLQLVQALGRLRSEGLREIAITTNGIALSRKLDELVQAGLTGVNLSLDTLDPLQFPVMTRRNGFEAVMKTLKRIIELKQSRADMRLKINCVVMHGINEDQIIPFVELGRNMDLEVRFIEYMPFSGNRWTKRKMVTFQDMLGIVRSRYPGLYRVRDHPNDTSKSYKVPGFTGKVGFITSMTQNFCGSCNRLRITSDGNLKVCLFGNAEVSLRDILRKQNDGQLDTFQQGQLPTRSGLKADRMERELLEVIGLAVKGKKEKHAGLGILEHQQNRPMILIDHYHNHMSRTRFGILPKTPVRVSYPTFDRQICLYSIKKTMRPVTPPHDKHSKSTKANRRDKDESHNAQPSRGFSSSHIKHESSRASPNNHHQRNHNNNHNSAKFPHLTPSGTAHMVSVTHKPATVRTAVAICTVTFSNPLIPSLIATNQIRKGDVLSVARIAGIMAAKRTSELLPLCHPIPLSHVHVDAEVFGRGTADEKRESKKINDDNITINEVSEKNKNDNEDDDGGDGDHVKRHTQDLMNNGFHQPNDRTGGVRIKATVACVAQTGVEMEALCAANVAALTVYDMCKALDKQIVLGDCRVVEKRKGEEVVVVKEEEEEQGGTCS